MKALVALCALGCLCSCGEACSQVASAPLGALTYGAVALVAGVAALVFSAVAMGGRSE